MRLAGARCVHVPLLPPLFALRLGSRARGDHAAHAHDHHQQSAESGLHGDGAQTTCDALAALVAGTDLLVLSDEVYEHLVYDGSRHHSVLSDPGLRERALAVFSFGKSLHATGLRVGYCVAPPPLTAELRSVHQFNTFTIATAFQHAIAAYLAARPDVFAGLAPFFDRKRQLLARGLAGSGFRVLPAQGTYFTLVDYAASRAAGRTRRRRCRAAAAGGRRRGVDSAGAVLPRAAAPHAAAALLREAGRDAGARGGATARLRVVLRG